MKCKVGEQAPHDKNDGFITISDVLQLLLNEDSGILAPNYCPKTSLILFYLLTVGEYWLSIAQPKNSIRPFHYIVTKY